MEVPIVFLFALPPPWFRPHPLSLGSSVADTRSPCPQSVSVLYKPSFPLPRERAQVESHLCPPLKFLVHRMAHRMEFRLFSLAFRVFHHLPFWSHLLHVIFVYLLFIVISFSTNSLPPKKEKKIFKNFCICSHCFSSSFSFFLSFFF